MRVVDTEQFRRLARSSPWLWTTIEFRWREDGGEPRHAWIRRPGSLRVEDADGAVVQAFADSRPFPGAQVDDGSGWRPMPGRWPSDLEPVRGADGLVDEVPDDIDVDYDSPFFENYRWVAMLWPLEFADRVHDRDTPAPVPVELTAVTVVDHHGRVTWQATAHPTAGYDPRCDCCPLLSGAYDHERDEWIPGDASTVRIDAATGVCVRIEAPFGVELDVEILAVDRPLDDALFARPRRGWFRR